MLRKGEPTYLEEANTDQLRAFDTLKAALTNPQLPNPDLPYSDDTDACSDQIGCALLQTHSDGTRYPIGFWIRSLSPNEKNYSTGDRECLAVVWAVQILRPYLERRHLHLFTVQQALKWIMDLTESNDRLAGWRLRLLEFDFKVFYRKGAKNTIADAIFRLPTWGYLNVAPDLEIPCFTIESSAAQHEPRPPPLQKHSDTSSWLPQDCDPDWDPPPHLEVLAVDSAPTVSFTPLLLGELQEPKRRTRCADKPIQISTRDAQHHTWKTIVSSSANFPRRRGRANNLSIRSPAAHLIP